MVRFCRLSTILTLFSCLSYKDMAHTQCVSYETNGRASSMSNWDRLRGRVSTPGETKRLGAGSTFHHLTQQLVIKPIRYGWRAHSLLSLSLSLCFSSLIILRASWFTSPSQLNADDRFFNSSWMQMSHSLIDKQWCTAMLRVFLVEDFFFFNRWNPMHVLCWFIF